MLMGISSIEYSFILRNKKIKIAEEREGDYKRAIGWAFWGIILSILIAFFEDVFMPDNKLNVIQGLKIASYTAPLIIVFQWACNYMTASITMDLDEVQTQYKLQLNKEVLHYIQNNGNDKNKLSTQAVYENMNRNSRQYIIGRNTLQILKILTLRFRPVNEVVNELEKLTLTSEKVQLTLNDLVRNKKENGIHGSVNEGYFYIAPL